MLALAALLLFAAAPVVTQVEVTVTGSGWTSGSAVRRLMSTRAGEPFDADELDRDLARLRTLGILYDVGARTVHGPAGERVEIQAKDRWTLLPVLGLRRGGGRTTARVGISDHNAFGSLFTLYGELTSNAQIPFLHRSSADRVGNLVYTQVPRIFGTRLTPYASWTRDFLDFAAFQQDGAPGYVYDRARYALRGELRYELSALVSVMGGVEGRRDRYRTSDVTRAPGTPPSALDTVSALFGVQLGYVEDLISRQRGTELRLIGEAAGMGALTGTLQARGYFMPVERHNLCLQLLLQGTTGREESFLFHSGGLREIRGFIDSFFSGAAMGRANAEWRAEVLRSSFLMPAIGQLAAFADGGWVARRAGAVAGLDYQGPILSAGLGARIIPVPFARAVGRIDFAAGLVPRRTLDLSFSGQQFF
jgi:hypothetical protein